MMIDDEERDAIWQAMSVAFYALAHLLEENGLIDQDALAAEIGRYDAENDRLAANLRGMMATLNSRPFKRSVAEFTVINGGRND